MALGDWTTGWGVLWGVELLDRKNTCVCLLMRYIMLRKKDDQ